MKKVHREQLVENAVKDLNTVQPMSVGERIAWAVGILVVDLVVFVIPLASLFVFAIILARPAFVKDFVDRLYSDVEE